MNTFEQVLTEGVWTEILDGGTEIAFELIGSKEIRIFYNESATPPDISEPGNVVLSFPSGWDFEATGLITPNQRIWAKGENTIRGLR